MAGSRNEVEQHVLGYFHQRWPQAVEATKLRKDLKLKTAQILDIGAYFNGWHGIFLPAPDVTKCDTIKDMIELVWAKLSKRP